MAPPGSRIYGPSVSRALPEPTSRSRSSWASCRCRARSRARAQEPAVGGDPLILLTALPLAFSRARPVGRVRGVARRGGGRVPRLRRPPGPRPLSLCTRSPATDRASSARRAGRRRRHGVGRFPPSPKGTAVRCSHSCWRGSDSRSSWLAGATARQPIRRTLDRGAERRPSWRLQPSDPGSPASCTMYLTPGLRHLRPDFCLPSCVLRPCPPACEALDTVGRAGREALARCAGCCGFVAARGGAARRVPGPGARGRPACRDSPRPGRPLVDAYTSSRRARRPAARDRSVRLPRGPGGPHERASSTPDASASVDVRPVRHPGRSVELEITDDGAGL